MKELSPHNGGGETQNQMEIENEETEMSGGNVGLRCSVCLCSGLKRSPSWKQLAVLT